MTLHAGWNLACRLRCALSLYHDLGFGPGFFFSLSHTISADIAPSGTLASFACILHECSRLSIVLAPSVYSNLSFVMALSFFFFHSGLQCALVGCALTCAILRLIVLPLFCCFFHWCSYSLFLGADGYGKSSSFQLFWLLFISTCSACATYVLALRFLIAADPLLLNLPNNLVQLTHTTRTGYLAMFLCRLPDTGYLFCLAAPATFVTDAKLLTPTRRHRAFLHCRLDILAGLNLL
ncbi:hypothetical protein DEU56DRAFT_144555 [Suillus clintonianus]|uniref:uncharacterized protein n=1 Tax=Suillus clintonianus TaxID=1904413 RepID=UPI001B885FE4|nr:uncharacterized protein DEU56DRAFT_144555 [Suillus clintonianus]KAG2118372.1 hypothetical protein DEU56DRAFT_144555 [Suillus clintonianus]